MAKIVILAEGKDADAAKAALETGGLDFEILAPTASNLLHLVIGMVDDEVKEPSAPAEDEPKDDESQEEKTEKADEIPAEDDMAQESLGFVTIDGDKIQAVKSTKDTSTLFTKGLSIGLKTTFSLQEGMFAFWPEDINKLSHRMVVEFKNQLVNAALDIADSKREYPYLAVGKDLASLFTSK